MDVKNVKICFEDDGNKEEDLTIIDTSNKIDSISSEGEVVKHRKTNGGLKLQIHELRSSFQPQSPSDTPDDTQENSPSAVAKQLGWTALHKECASVRLDRVKQLLAASVDVMPLDTVFRTPLDVVGYYYYFNHEINLDHFRELIKLLLTAGGKFSNSYITGSKELNYSPLHTAAELESIEAIQELLDAGAPVNSLNKYGQTPMHICVRKQLKEHLELFIRHGYINNTSNVAPVDLRDADGYTILHAAVKARWLPGVRVALKARASITLNNNQQCPINSAVRNGDIKILQEILTTVKEYINTDCFERRIRNALFVATANGHVDCIKLLLHHGASINAVIPGNVNLLHVAAKCGNVDALKFILSQNPEQISSIIDSVTDHEQFRPIYFAVLKNHPDCVKALLSKNALVTPHTDLTETTPLHIAASQNHYEIAKMIIEHDKKTIHYRNWKGAMPLHEAIMNGNRDIIPLLLQNGAYLSSHDGSEMIKSIDMIVENISNPTEFLEEILDSYISINGNNIQDKNCTVTVDYSILGEHPQDTIRQMSVIKSLLETGNRYNQKRLLLHPLIESFLYLKWKALLPFFYMTLCLYGFFVFTLNIYIISVFYYKDKDKKLPCFLDPGIWKYALFVIVFIITVQELFHFKIKGKRYFVSVESWVKISVIFLSSFLPLVVKWDKAPDPEWARLIATVAVLLSWVEMMFLLSRFPNWGFYVVMFEQVSIKVTKILLTFAFLIIGFSLSFMIQFRSKFPFEGPFSALVKTMVMMTSEFDYLDHFNKNTATEISASIVILRVVFLSFLVLSSIALMNLIVGVAVNDLNNLEVIGNIQRLQKQVWFLATLEDIFNYVVLSKFRKILPMSFIKRIVPKEVQSSVLRPQKSNCKFKKQLPSHIREAIFEKAQMQRKKMDDQLGSDSLKERLDQVHEDCLKIDNMMKQLNKKVDRMASNMNSLLSHGANRNLCSKGRASSFDAYSA